MKIIALLPVKNEEWVLPFYLKSMQEIADEIIALDDNSTDQSRQILESAGVKIIEMSEDEISTEKTVNMSRRRNLLLSAARQAGGTHLVFLDADEIFSKNFSRDGRKIISGLKAGQKLSMRWVTLWKSAPYERVDGAWYNLYKDFIFADDGQATFENKNLSEGRTPGSNDQDLKFPSEKGVVFHLQFLAWNRNLYKQAWYRMQELVDGRRNAKRINHTYSITLDSSRVKTGPLPNVYQQELRGISSLTANYSEYKKEILNLFDQYGILFFEPLEIWHISDLKDEFLKRVGRLPKSQTYGPILVKLNALRHKFN
ncbi:MAG TPA: glycosyltransferase [Candidatus Paceibacterota bacterium]|nr:glycosyltransferase [Candidatus Paceibacterota bacterium]